MVQRLLGILPPLLYILLIEMGRGASLLTALNTHHYHSTLHVSSPARTVISCELKVSQLSCLSDSPGPSVSAQGVPAYQGAGYPLLVRQNRRCFNLKLLPRAPSTSAPALQSDFRHPPANSPLPGSGLYLQSPQPFQSVPDR